MNQKEEFKRLKNRIEKDPDTPRCGRCGSWMLRGSSSLLCGRCRGELGGPGPFLIVVLIVIALGVLVLGVRWIAEYGGGR